LPIRERKKKSRKAVGDRKEHLVGRLKGREPKRKKKFSEMRPNRRHGGRRVVKRKREEKAEEGGETL